MATLRYRHLHSRLPVFHVIADVYGFFEADDEIGWKEARERFERQLLQSRLRRYPGEMNGAAKSLGLSRSRQYELTRRYGLKEI